MVQEEETGLKTDLLQKNDPWAKEKQNLQQQLATNHSIINQLQEKVAKLEHVIVIEQNIENPLMRLNIATPPLARGNIQSPIDVDVT